MLESSIEFYYWFPVYLLSRGCAIFWTALRASPASHFSYIRAAGRFTRRQFGYARNKHKGSDMPTTIEILNAAQQREFKSPPHFTAAERQAHCELSPQMRKHLRTLRTPESKVSLILQYAYFNAKGFFFEANQFREIDIQYIYRVFGFPSPKTPVSKEDYPKVYGGANALRHRQIILKIKGWKEIQEAEWNSLMQFASWESAKQTSPKKMLWALHAHCWKMRWVIPSYDALSTIISQGYLEFEASALAKIEGQLPQANKDKLEELLVVDNRKSLLARVKRIDQSTKTLKLKKNAQYLAMFKDYFLSNETLINDLGLTDSATNYYADAVMSAKAFQLDQFKDRNKTYLYMLAFIKDQLFLRQDAGMKGFLSAVRKSINKANNKLDEFERKNNAEKNKAIDAVSDSQKRLTKFIKDIILIADDKALSDERKVELIRSQAIEIIKSHDDEFETKANFLDECRDKERKDLLLNDALIEQSRRLSLAVGDTLCLLIFDEDRSNPEIIEAIRYYRENKKKIGQNAPTSFLLKKEKEAVLDGESINIPLYKMFLYRQIASLVKSGELSLKYSYEYRSLEDYMIERDRWNKDKDQLIEDAGLVQYKNVKHHLDLLKEKLESIYVQVNLRHAKGDNGYLLMRPNGRFHVKTPATDYEQSKYISTVLSTDGEIPITQVLRETDRACQFTELFTHHTHRNTVKTIPSAVCIAGIMGLGCNIGVRRMARKSIGIEDGVLVEAVNWRFSIENLTKINQRIVAEIETLKLPNIFTVEENCVLSSSDGKKITVAVDSLLANYSFKYYGKEKGVAIYTFINEKQSLFHTTVFSSSDREAIYLIDGLLNNRTTIQHIHATDTHGYTEAIFAATHLIDISFAPRFKRLEDQVIYSFLTKAKYEEKGYRILPSRQINRKLIEENWDEILRFMATIKLGRTSGSQLFKRLNSYSKDHPLYKALKEFGRILKSLHILNFFDDLELRQKIQKQLNRVEISHLFSDAVFWDRGRQFHVGTKEEQEQYTLCKTIIQNSIIFWNYLFLSDRLIKSKNPQDKEDMIESIMKGSVLAWRHINFSGYYDFTTPDPKDRQFNIGKIKKLEVKKPKK